MSKVTLRRPRSRLLRQRQNSLMFPLATTRVLSVTCLLSTECVSFCPLQMFRGCPLGPYYLRLASLFPLLATSTTDVSAFPAELIELKTGVEEPPVAVQATAPFLPATEKDIVRDVTEKRLLHRVFIATQSTRFIEVLEGNRAIQERCLLLAVIPTKSLRINTSSSCFFRCSKGQS